MTYYVSPNGSNTTGNGTFIAPWKTLYFASTRPGLVAGDVIYLNPGTYLAVDNNQQVLLPVGVSVAGENKATTIINCGLTTASQPFIKLETNNGWLGVYGNQMISNLTIEGNNATFGCIRINFRSNVKVRNMIIRNFTTYGVVFNGMPDYTWTADSIFEPGLPMPDHWCVGNELTDCTITNCTQGNSYGNVSIGQQDGIIISGNTITQPIKGSGGNCGGVKFIDDGYNKNTDFHDNIITVTINPANLFNFALEIWYELGGCKYYNNTIEGTCDFDAAIKGASTYSVWFHHNNVGHPAHVTSANSSNFGLDLESSCSDMIIEKNYIHHVKDGIYFSHIWPNAEHPYNNIFTNIRISCNKFVNIGMLNGPSTWEPIYGIYCGREQEAAGTAGMNNIEILNNTIECTAVTPNSYYVVGIWLPQCDMIVNGFTIRNNIIKGFTGGSAFSAPVFGTGLYGSLNDINDLVITHNDFYGNGNGNDVLLVSGYAPNPYTYTVGTKSNPNLDADYKITASSPAYHAGIDVGLDTDYDGDVFGTSPSMGADEVVQVIKLTTINIVGGRPVHLHDKPSWITVKDNADDSVINIGDLIPNGTVLAIAPNANNVWGIRAGIVILQDNMALPNSCSINVGQGTNPALPDVSVIPNPAYVNNFTITNDMSSVAAGSSLVNTFFTPVHNSYGNGVTFTMRYALYFNGVLDVTGSMSVTNNYQSPNVITMHYTATAGDLIEVRVWVE